MSVVLGCGDVGVKRAHCDSIFAGCAPTLQRADLCFGQLETTISERGAPVPNARLAMRAPLAMARSARAAGFQVMSFAGNHCLDFGYEAFDDTLEAARAAGIALCGAGSTLAAARASVQLDAGGLRVAFVAASSILPEGYAASEQRRGCAPLRALTSYVQIEPDQPGTPPAIRSFAHRQDLQALTDAVTQARACSDVVIVSLHWGIHMVPYTLADYQREVAHALIDAGADAIFGHHPHLLKGVEIYRERPIYYSLGNFAIEQPHVWDPQIIQTASFRHLVSLHPDWQLDQIYVLPELTRLTGIAKLICAPCAAPQVRFVPAWIGDDSAPQVLRADDARFHRVREFLLHSSRQAGLATLIEVQGDELVIRAGEHGH